MTVRFQKRASGPDIGDPVVHEPSKCPPAHHVPWCSLVLTVTAVVITTACTSHAVRVAAREQTKESAQATPTPQLRQPSQWATQQERLQFPQSSTRRRPFAVTMSGGGHRAMTTAMGIARALSTVDGGWESVTHLSAISGGAWFATQLVHSRRFYDDVVNRFKPIDTVVSEWGKEFAAAVQLGIETGRINTSLRADHPVGGCSTSCSDVSLYIEMFVELYMTKAQYPIIDWGACVAEQLAPFIPQPSMLAADDSARQATRQGGLQTVTLIQGSALMHDSWVPKPGGGTTRATASVVMNDPAATLSISTNQWPFPVAHVLPGPDTSFSGWYLSSEVSEVNVSADGAIGPLSLANAPVGAIAASTSAAFGLVASPSALKAAIRWAVNKLAGTSLAETAESSVVLQRILSSEGLIDTCMPTGLHNLAIPMKIATQAEASSLPTTYRLADGVFGEKNGIAFALARMQADCQAARSSLDCPDGNATTLWLAATDHSPALSLQKLPQPHDINVLFADYPDPSRGAVVPDWRTVPATVFADAFPSSAEWHVYEANEQSKLWYGVLTTKYNKFYGVEGGWKVRTLLLRPNLDLGGVTDGSLGGGTQMFYGGSLAASSSLPLSTHRGLPSRQRRLRPCSGHFSERAQSQHLRGWTSSWHPSLSPSPTQQLRKASLIRRQGRRCTSMRAPRATTSVHSLL